MAQDEMKPVNEGYGEFLEAVKKLVRQAQLNSLKAVNRELIMLYWDLGRIVAEKQAQYGWGESVVEKLARDLSVEFPGIKGFSTSNVWRIRNFYLSYKDSPILAPLVREISWSHNLVIMERCKSEAEREFYIRKVAELSWSRATLVENIRNKAYNQVLLNQTNFESTLPADRQAKALMAVKDEYNFDFIELSEPHLERELEDALVLNITKFLAEMGGYFTFVGRQVRVETEGEEFFIDLLFFHRQLRCLVAIDLKAGKFLPEYAGKMQFYVNALNEKVRLEGENPSIGIIVCRQKNRTVVEYTLKDVNMPIGVATYKTYSGLEGLPQKIAKYLPSEEELDKRLGPLPEVPSPGDDHI